MKIERAGNIPLGEPRRLVALTADDLDGEWKYIDIEFDLGHKTQRHIGNRIEDVLCNTEWYGREAISEILSEGNELTAKLMKSLETLQIQDKDDLIYKGVKFYCHEKTMHIFSFSSHEVSDTHVCVYTDLDLTPFDVKTIEFGKDYHIQYFYDFHFLDLRYSKDVNYFNELKESVSWIEGIIKDKSNRLNEYIKVLDEYDDKDPGIIDAEQLKVSIALYELAGIRTVHRAFIEKEDSIKKQVEKVIDGVAFKYEFDALKEDECREFLYELKVAAYIALSGHEVVVNKRADVIVDKDVFVECKKIRSSSKLTKRIKDAIIQLKEKESVDSGIIYVDISDAVPNLKDEFFVVNQKSLHNFLVRKKSSSQHLDDYVRNLIIEKFQEYIGAFIHRNSKRIESLIGDSVLVLNVERAIFHVSPLHERVGLVKCAYVYSNRNSLRYNYIVENSMRSYTELMKI
ncbi:hypothetical protein [Providencia rettgeri]|uniref:hypothetical protein n=1 Tax=Providencia rettgeri TaxID=587 RepID=UPI001BAD8B8D|nr:hypothetical protein [Providencia rettgeri]ELT5688336.1 hypothetical protein [Providencia rettgeri]MBS0861602.1 hypothetical protein [Providencia rettgeri]MBS0875547.1 hypothetical protein [Providencia rettgeri]MBS0922658.1 hypothetical protein [Providencia rettgeri]